jgi:choice-of-anchor B domain-containing protein
MQRRVDVKRFFVIAVCSSLILTGLAIQQGVAQDEDGQALPKKHAPIVTAEMREQLANPPAVQDLPPLDYTPCVDGMAGSYPCRDVDLASFTPVSAIGGGTVSDTWGWTDPQTRKEYSLVGRSTGTAIVDITDPVNPVYIGNLPTNASSTTWREIATFRNYMLVVCDLCGNHGMQVFDLTRVRDVDNPPVTFDEDAIYEGVDTVHSIEVNDQTGYAYLNGSNTCSGGLHMVNVRNPLNPTFAGCFSSDGYTHDSMCVIYRGPDAEHRGDEICFAANEDTLTVVDVTNKSAPVLLDRNPYPGASYTHSVWLNRSHNQLVLCDELDELFDGNNLRLRYFSISDLENTSLSSTYTHPTVEAIDHNPYWVGPYVYLSAYRAGLRVFRAPSTEVAYFDTYPANDDAAFNSIWSVHPFYRSGNITAGGIEQGLFVLTPTF